MFIILLVFLEIAHFILNIKGDPPKFFLISVQFLLQLEHVQLNPFGHILQLDVPRFQVLRAQPVCLSEQTLHEHVEVERVCFWILIVS